MKLVKYDLENAIDFERCPVWTLVCESPHRFCNLAQSIYAQINGADGDWQLLDVHKETLAKNAAYVVDYFGIELNDKKASNALQDKLKNIAFDELHTVATHEIIAALDRYAKLLSLDVDVPVTVGDVDFAQISKIISFAILSEGDSVLDRLVDYVTLISKLTPVKLVVCVHLSSYLEQNELQQFFRHCMQCDVCLLCLETHLTHILPEERVLVCDRDLCEYFPDKVIDI